MADTFDCVKNIITIFNISRDIFFDLYLNDLLKLASIADCGINKAETYTLTRPNLSAVKKCAVGLMERTERMIRAKVVEEYLSSYETVKKAKIVLMKRCGLSESVAIDKIKKESAKSNRSIREVSTMVILAEGCLGTQKKPGMREALNNQ